MNKFQSWTKPIRGIAVLGAVLLGAAAAQAHNVWLEPDAKGGYLIQFGGHEGQLEEFDPAKLQHVRAFDRRGRRVDSKVESAPDGLRVLPSPQAATIAVELDNGYFSGTAGAMRQIPMNQNPGATRGVHALKFHKTVIVWNAVTQKELDQQFELIPQQGIAPHAGDWLTILVKLNGKPFQGARVSLGETGPAATSDEKGRVKIKTTSGTNHVQAIYRQPVQDDPQLTERSYEALLSFAVH